MKKIRLFSLILAAALSIQAALPVFAAPEEEPAATPPASSAPMETTLPPETEPTMPADFLGDASVEYGSRTLDAKRPLSDEKDYTAEATAALLYDIGSDTLVFAQDPDKRVFPASLTKIMTCLMTIEMQQDLEAVVTVTKEGLKGMEPGGSIANLQVDEEMTVRNLLYCLMVRSANDAASTLAAYNSGTIEAFVEKMNQRAVEIGCTGTHFVNPHGLHDENHYTTARDMAKIMREAMKYPLFEELFGTAEYVVPQTNKSEARELITTNYLIRSGGQPSVLDTRVLGGKTGFTTPAGRCLVAAAEYEGTKLISVVMGTQAKYGANRYTYIRYGNFEETSELLDYAYSNYTTMQVLAEGQIMAQFPVAQGAQDAFGAVRTGMSSAVPLGSSYESLRYEYALHEGGLTAPLSKDADIGLVRVWFGNTCLAQQELYASTAVAVKEEAPQKPHRTERNSIDWWNIALWGVLIVVALIFVVMLLLRLRAIVRHRRRQAQRRRRR